MYIYTHICKKKKGPSITQPYAHICVCMYTYLQPIPFEVTFLKALSKLKAQSSNVSFHCNVAKETFEL